MRRLLPGAGAPHGDTHISYTTQRHTAMNKTNIWKTIIKVIIAMATTLLGALGVKDDGSEAR